jgi:serine/threonine-protein kinase
MAPEQVLGQQLDVRTDLYAVGVILYRLLTATLPFEGEIPAVVLRQQVGDAPPPLHTRRDGLPAWCEPIVHRALAKPKAERFQTADEFREALTRAAPASAAPLRAPVARRALGRWRRVRRHGCRLPYTRARIESDHTTHQLRRRVAFPAPAPSIESPGATQQQPRAAPGR